MHNLSTFALCSTSLQVLANVSDGTNVLFRESLHELRKMCGIKHVLPKACTLTESLLECVYEGIFDGSKVRVRRVRMRPGGDPVEAKEVCDRFRAFLCLDTDETHRNSTR